MKKFLLISPKNRSVYNFRGDLIKEIQSKGYEVVVTGPDRENIDRVEALGVRFVEVPLKKNSVNMFSDLKYLNNLRKVIKKEKPDVTLGYTIKPSIYGAIAAKLCKVKNINSMITGGGYVFASKSFKAKIIRLFAFTLYKIGLGCCNNVIFQNPDDKNDFVSNKLVKEKKCHCVYGSGVNMEKYKIMPFPEKTTFFMLTRVMYSKGACEYLAAAEKVKKLYPDTRFMLLGAIENIQDSLPREDVMKYVDSGVIDYYGETTDVTPYFAQCSVYCLPSYREGTPRTVLEAMSMGRPILTTDAPGCRQTVIEGENGWLVPVKDVDTLAEKMIWYIENADKIPEMGEKSHKLCEERFDVRKVNAEMLLLMGI